MTKDFGQKLYFYTILLSQTLPQKQTKYIIFYILLLYLEKKEYFCIKFDNLWMSLSRM